MATYRFVPDAGAQAIQAAPCMPIADGDLTFQLLDPEAQPVADALVTFQVGSGAGWLQVNSAVSGFPVPEERQVVRRRTGSDGKVNAPVFVLGPHEGPNVLLVQAENATLEHAVVGSYANTLLQVVAPTAADGPFIAGQQHNFTVQAIDTGYGNRPVPKLPLELDVRTGAARLGLLSGGLGCYELRETNDQGRIDTDIHFSNRAESVTVRVVPFFHRRIAATDWRADVRSPMLLSYTNLAQGTVPTGSVPHLLRMSVSDSADTTLSSNDREVADVWLAGEEVSGRVDVHPEAQAVVGDQSSFAIHGGQATPYRMAMRAPDYPDTGQVFFEGTLQDDYEGATPALNTPAVLPSGMRTYINLNGGGSKDDRHRLAMGFTAGAVQYLGPGATSQPIQLRATVMPPDGVRRLVRASVKFKVRLSPFNSVVDDPGAAANRVAGGVAANGAGPFVDEFELPLTGIPGPHNLSVVLRQNGFNYDHLVDITVKATIEDDDGAGGLVQVEEETSLHLRAAVLRPRVLLTKRQGNDFSPINEGSVRPVTVTDSMASFVAPNATDAFYVELLSHDVGATINCRVRAPRSHDVTLNRVGTVSPGVVRYRSDPCYAALDAQLPATGLPANTHFIQTNASAPLRVEIRREMPGNTERIRYTVGQRPVTGFDLLTTGDATARDDLPTPWLHVDIGDRGALTGRINGTAKTVRLTVNVRDIAADLGAVATPEVLVNGTAYPLTWSPEANTFGRAGAQVGQALVDVPVAWGVQAVQIEVAGGYGGRTRQLLWLDVQERTNKRHAPEHLEITARRLEAPRRIRMPLIRYIYFAGTTLTQGGLQSVNGLIEALPNGSPGAVDTIGLTLTPRPTVATHMSSAPFVSICDDLAGPGLAGTLLVPLGGRIQWSCTALPHEAGQLSLIKRQQLRHLRLAIETNTGVGWQPDDTSIDIDDERRVVAYLHPSNGQPSVQVQLAMRDVADHPQPGEDRSVWLELWHTAGDRYEQAGYLDSQFAFRASGSLFVREACDETISTTLGVRTAGPGWLVADQGLDDFPALRVPVVPQPRRRADASGSPIDNEGVGSFSRLGAKRSVVPATGELVLENTDRQLAGRGLTSLFARTYRSNNLTPGPLGIGWHASWDQTVWAAGQDTLLLQQGDGQVITLTRSGAEWQAPPGLSFKLEVSDRTIGILAPQGMVLTYLPVLPGLWRLASQVDQYGNTQHLISTDHGQVAAQTDTFGRPFTLLWDESLGRVTSLGDFAGGTVAYETYGRGQTHGARGNLSQVRSPRVTNPDNPFPHGRLHRYTYATAASGHHLLTLQDPRGVDENLPVLLTNHYTPEHRVERQQYVRGDFRFRWDATGTLTWQDRRGTDHTVTFYPASNDGWAALPHQQSVTVEGDVHTHTLTYDAHKHISRHEYPSGRVDTFVYDHSATDPRDRDNLLEYDRWADGVGDDTVFNNVGLPTFTTPFTTTNPGVLSRRWTYAPGLQRTATAMDPNGHVVTFEYENGFLTKEIHPPIQRVPAGMQGPFERVTQYQINHWGQMLRVVDANGVLTRYYYHPAADPTGPATTHVGTVDAPAGFVAVSEIDVQDTSVQRAAHLAPVRTQRSTYRYDHFGFAAGGNDGSNASQTTAHNELGERITDIGGEGETTRYRYDANGELTDVIQEVRDLAMPDGVTASAQTNPRHHRTYDRDGHLLELIEDADAMALKTVWELDGNGNATMQNSPMVYASVTTQPHNRIKRVYDVLNRLREEHIGFGDPQAIELKYDYNKDNKLTHRYEGGDLRELITRDAFGRGRSVTDPSGTVREVMLDAIGTVIGEKVTGSVDGDPAHVQVLAEHYQYANEAGHGIAIRERADAFYPTAPTGLPAADPMDSGWRVSERWFDAVGNELRSADALGLVRNMQPDGHQQPAHVWDSVGRGVRFHYDGAGRALKVEQIDPLGTNQFDYVYDKSGRVTSIANYNGIVQRNYYDSRGQLRYREDPWQNRVERRYDAVGRQVVTNTFLYESGRRLKINNDPNRLQDIIVESTLYYDNGLVAERRNSSGQIVESFDYHPTNRLAKRTFGEDKQQFADGSELDLNPGLETESYTWRKDGQLDKITTPRGAVVEHHYDAAGRLTTVKLDTASAATAQGWKETRYRYNGLREVVDAQNVGGIGARVERMYTTLGEVCWERAKHTYGGRDFEDVIRADYREDGTRVLLRYPSNRRIIRTTQTATGQLRLVADNAANRSYSRYSYHGARFSHRTDLQSGLTYGFGYDANKEVLEIRTVRGANFTASANMVTGKRHVYDEGSRLVVSQDLSNQELTRSFYDSAWRLDARINGYSATDPSQLPKSGSWNSFDVDGNLYHNETGAISSRTSDGRYLVNLASRTSNRYNAANQLQERTVEDHTKSPMQSMYVRPRYDKDGNLIEDEQHEYTYDHRNQLVKADAGGTSTPLELHYDPLGRRIRANDRRYVFWGGDMLEEHPDDGSNYKLWVYGRDGEAVTYETNVGGSDTVFYLHADRSGNVEYLTDFSGQVRERYGLSTFGAPQLVDANGQPISSTTGTGNPLLMHGRYYHAGHGLYVVGPRVFNPQLARFLQRDPAGALFDPMSRGNPYLFAANNPTMFGENGNWVWLLGAYVLIGAGVAYAETWVEQQIHTAVTPTKPFDFTGAYGRNLVVGLLTNWIPGGAAVRGARWTVQGGLHFARFALATEIEWGWENMVRGNNVSIEQVAFGNAAGGLAGTALALGLRGVGRVLPNFGNRLRGQNPGEYLETPDAHIYHPRDVDKLVPISGHCDEIGRVRLGKRAFEDPDMTDGFRMHEFGHRSIRPTFGPMWLRKMRGDLQQRALDHDFWKHAFVLADEFVAEAGVRGRGIRESWQIARGESVRYNIDLNQAYKGYVMLGGGLLLSMAASFGVGWLIADD